MPGLQCALTHSANSFLVGEPVSHQIRDLPHHQLMLIGKAQQIVGIRHSTVVIQYFCEHRRWQKPGESRQIHRRLGWRGAGEHAPRGRSNRENMTRLHQIRSLAGRIHRYPNSPRSIRCRDARIDTRGGFDRQRERRERVVSFHHQRELQLLASLRGHRQTDQSASLTRHKGNVLSLAVLCRHHDKAGHAPRTVLIQQQTAMAMSQLTEHFIDVGILGHSVMTPTGTDRIASIARDSVQ